MMPIRRIVGDKVTVTPKNMETMESASRSCVTPQQPPDSYLQKINRYVGITGEVSHTFLPGYEVTVTFPDSQAFHMKDNWITSV